MAVDVTQLAAALRLTEGTAAPTEPIPSILNRLLGVAQAFVEITAIGAPDAIKDEATVRMASYLYDSPTAGPEGRYADAWRNSGATSLVARWVVHRLGDATAEATTGVSGGVTAERVREMIREELQGVLIWR